MVDQEIITVADGLTPGNGALSRVSKTLAACFGRTLLISTLHQGPRWGDLSEAETQDLAALREVLPEGRLSLADNDRDAASPEAPMLTAIRRAEGAAPALPAVLLPRSETEAQSLLMEASAAGYEPGTESYRRSIGLSFAAMQGLSVDGSRVRISAGTSWDDLSRAAADHGLGLPGAALAGRYARPAAAAVAGIFAAPQAEWFRGEVHAVSFDLPPSAVGATDRTWLVPPDAAGRLLEAAAQLYEPLYAETVSPTDLAVLRAANLIGGRPAGRAGLRVVVQGTRPIRAATIRAIGRLVSRAGGRAGPRGSLPADDDLANLAAWAGAARIAVASAPEELPAAAIVAPRRTAIRGQIRDRTVIWYPRDLARSLDQAAELIEGVTPGTVGGGGHQAEPGPVVQVGDDGGWEALRAALRDALP